MPDYKCPIEECPFSTGDLDPAVGAAMLMIHNNIHISAPTNANAAAHQRAPKIDRPKISAGSSEEIWNTFMTRWTMFKRSTGITGPEAVQHLFHCCEDELGDALLKAHPDAATGNEDELVAKIKKMAVIPVAVCVRRAELLGTQQDHGENARAFCAKLKGKAATCSYTADCTSDTCTQVINFTDIMVKDVLVSGLADEEVKKEVLGWSELDNKSLEETVTFIEAKEMARDAMNKGHVTAGISTYKKKNTDSNAAARIQCKSCRVETDKFVWNKRQKKMIEVMFCMLCWRKKNPRRSNVAAAGTSSHDEASALMIGEITGNAALSDALESSGISSDREIVLDHHIFDSSDGWKKSESMPHPTLRLLLSTNASDYDHINATCPSIKPSHVNVVTDTGAQSVLMSIRDFYRVGFKDTDLLPVKRTMRAANMEEIKILGAVFVRLTGTDTSGKEHTAPIMAYVSPSTEKIYISREALVQLGVIPRNFPEIGAATETSAIETQIATCGCPVRTMPPERPASLPFPVCPENNEKMKAWIGETYKASTWNKCTHQVLKGVTGPPLKLHVDPNAKPKAVHTPYKIPLNWEEEVKKQLLDDVNLGVLEFVPHGEPSEWCHPMVVTRKSDGGPRRCVDMSSLNKSCQRETHHVKPPFDQARSIPPNTWKSVTDAWNGFHCVPLAEEDRAKTTFITLIGRLRYLMAPQGAVASGDGYSRRFDEVIADVVRKTKCVDDTAQWDDDLETHWWRMIDFVELCGRNGIILNFNKFQFAQREITFAGFRITETQVKPLDKYLRAILEFPTPTRTTDARSWFGLVHQVSHYNKLTEMLEPFKPFLSPKTKFVWNDELDRAFEASKVEIVNAIKEGVEIFDLTKPTCLRPDWSQKGIGYFLSQKHCECDSTTPDCCEYGWRITLAGSRFLKPAETRYAPIEGEALAIAWSLEHTKYFTQGCDNLVVVTDHKPLVKLFTDRTLDQITNSRLFSLKQRTLPWRFDVKYMPGKSNNFSDATSRNPVSGNDGDVACSEILAGIMGNEPDEECIDDIAFLPSNDNQDIRAVTWHMIKQETCNDNLMRDLSMLINSSFPNEKQELSAELFPYWNIRHNLYIVDGVIMMKDQVVVPRSLRNSVVEDMRDRSAARILIPQKFRQEILQTLHSAHQGVVGMNERARAGVYWPGITKDIESVRAACRSCNRSMPSQPRPIPVEPLMPTTPFEAVASDYFKFEGHYYFIAADRLSGWFEVQQIRVGTNEAGSKGLCQALRRLMTQVGVPKELSSDGGPEFTARETEDFFKRWGIHHRISSAYYPASNGRAELAVKTAKRLLMDNVSANGSLNNDAIVRAFLTYRNTPDPGCKLSPAQVLLGRQLRDTLPSISKDVMLFNNSEVNPQWREAWKAKEEALKVRYVKSMENLAEHARPLRPLEHGDRVIIQNQNGRFPKKWDKSGTVVEVRPNDQYYVKVDGSGRLTLRNRRFLRKYAPHQLNQPVIRSHEATGPLPEMQPRTAPTADVPPRPAHVSTPAPTPAPDEGSWADLDEPSPASEKQPAAKHVEPEMTLSTTPSASVLGGADHARPAYVVTPSVVDRGTTSDNEQVSSTRPKRVRFQRNVYDASTGRYGPPQAIAEDI